jgi:glucose uptake protein GlcU
MKKNMALADRIIRLVVAAVIAVLYFTETITGTLAIVLGIVAIIFVITAIFNFCPLYTLLGISTRKKSLQ